MQAPLPIPHASIWYGKAAQKGNAIAENNLGLLYYRGEGTAQDYPKAFAWFSRAAEQGFDAAQNNLGAHVPERHRRGTRLRQGPRLADQGCLSGQLKAEWSLGQIYSHALGVPRNYSQALVWYTKAAQQDLAAAQVDLGVMYFNGLGTTQDYAQALRWFSKAAAQGSAAAENNLGVMYLNGLGVSPDKAKARDWLQQSCSSIRTSSAKRWLAAIDAGTPPTSVQSAPVSMSSIAHSADDAGIFTIHL